MTARQGLIDFANKAQVTHWSVLPVISQVLDSATHFDGLERAIWQGNQASSASRDPYPIRSLFD